MSRRPKASMVPLTSEAAPSMVPTSANRACACPPALTISASVSAAVAVPSGLDAERLLTATAAPSSARRRAMALPMLWPDPVTRATLPSSRVNYLPVGLDPETVPKKGAVVDERHVLDVGRPEVPRHPALEVEARDLGVELLLGVLQVLGALLGVEGDLVVGDGSVELGAAEAGGRLRVVAEVHARPRGLGVVERVRIDGDIEVPA